MLSFIFNQWDVSFPVGGLAGTGGIGLRRRRNFVYVDRDDDVVVPTFRRVRAFRSEV